MSLFFAVVVFFIGASIGSFLNVCILRWPAGESVVKPRSKCPRCGNGLAWFDNVPVISWFVLRARCRNCREPISAMYPAVEALTGAVWVATLVWLGPRLTVYGIAASGASAVRQLTVTVALTSTALPDSGS